MMMNFTYRDNNGSANHHSDNEDNSTPETIIIISCVLNAPLMLISILGNALVLAAIIRTPSIRSTPHMIMLCSLAVPDFLVGLIGQPVYITHHLTESRFIMTLHAVKQISFSLCGVSLLTMTVLTVDRFLALHYHMRYSTLVTESRIKYTLTIIWLISFFAAGLYFLKERVHSFLSGAVTIICLLTCTFCYLRIYRIVRRHQIRIHAHQQAVQSFNVENNLNMTRLKRSALNTFVFCITLTICFFPMYVLLTLDGLSYKDRKTEWAIASTSVFFNSCINPVLYCWRLRQLRTAVVKTARQMLCKQTEN